MPVPAVIRGLNQYARFADIARRVRRSPVEAPLHQVANAARRSFRKFCRDQWVLATRGQMCANIVAWNRRCRVEEPRTAHAKSPDVRPLIHRLTRACSGAM